MEAEGEDGNYEEKMMMVIVMIVMMVIMIFSGQPRVLAAFTKACR